MIASRHAVLLCGFVATALGLGYMAAAGAPVAYLVMNAGAFAIGLTAVAVLSQQPLRVSPGATCLGLAILLLISVLLGTAVEGANALGAPRKHHRAAEPDFLGYRYGSLRKCAKLGWSDWRLIDRTGARAPA